MTDEELISAIKAVLPTMRAKAHEVGSMSGLWDSIIDFEELLKGRVHPGWSRRKTLLVIADHFGITTTNAGGSNG